MKRTVAVNKDPRDSNGVIHASDLTNESVIDRYRLHMQAVKRSPQHIKNRTNLIRRLAEFLHPTPLLAATYDQLFDWQVSISRLGAATVASYVAGTRVFYRWAVKPSRLITASPAEDLITPTVPDYKPRPVPEADFDYALTACADQQVKMWLKLGRYAGLRCVEVARLSRDHLINDPPRLHVIGKGNRHRIVFISDELFDESMVWGTLHKTGPMFRRASGLPFTAQDISEIISSLFAELGLPYTMHQLRHLYGTDALHRTKNLRLVQAQMGHRSPTTTAGYTEVDEPEAIALAAELGEDLRTKNRRRSA